MVIRRSEIWWANLPPPSGSEPGFRRPVLIVQTDGFNQSRFRTLVAVALTSNVRLADSPGNVMLPRLETGLREDSVVNVSQLTALDKNWLEARISACPGYLLRRVEAGLRLLLGL
ncbi:MAG: mRNA interferase MazF2 [Acidobacteria bacterium]|nr:MAG: mRNA interferase MazF2 [Acidobacteriota bacterium]